MQIREVLLVKLGGQLRVVADVDQELTTPDDPLHEAFPGARPLVERNKTGPKGSVDDVFQSPITRSHCLLEERSHIGVEGESCAHTSF